MTKSGPKDYAQIGDTLFEVLQALEVKAGIEDARRGPLFPLYYDSDAPWGSERKKTEDEEESQDREDYIRRRIRSLYFSVHDLDLRKQLIQKERELTDNARYEFKTDVQTAEVKVREAKSIGKNWVWWASFCAIGWVALGWSLFQLPGALAGALVAYFHGRFDENDAKERRALSVKQAEDDLKEVRSIYHERLNSEYTFTKCEAESGEPDKEWTTKG
jgi:hypothetical protein